MHYDALLRSFAGDLVISELGVCSVLFQKAGKGPGADEVCRGDDFPPYLGVTPPDTRREVKITKFVG